MKVVIGGATGYVGSALASSLRAEGHEVVAVSRGGTRVPALAATVAWDRLRGAVEGAAAVVNLAGASLGAPFWSERRKQEIRASRIETTRALAEAIRDAVDPPGVYVTASGIDYYGNSGESLVDEAAPAGTSFLADVCADWEAAADAAPVRRVAVRTALVLGPKAPALRTMALPFRLFLGGPLGDGRQYFPWIARDDLVGLYRLAIDEATLEGPLNAVAPELLRQRDAASVFGRVLHRPALLPTPAFVLRLALGDQADLLLHGQRAVSAKLGGFTFAAPTLREALERSFRG